MPSSGNQAHMWCAHIQAGQTPIHKNKYIFYVHDLNTLVGEQTGKPGGSCLSGARGSLVTPAITAVAV